MDKDKELVVKEASEVLVTTCKQLIETLRAHDIASSALVVQLAKLMFSAYMITHRDKGLKEFMEEDLPKLRDIALARFNTYDNINDAFEEDL